MVPDEKKIRARQTRELIQYDAIQALYKGNLAILREVERYGPKEVLTDKSHARLRREYLRICDFAQGLLLKTAPAKVEHGLDVDNEYNARLLARLGIAVIDQKKPLEIPVTPEKSEYPPEEPRPEPKRRGRPRKHKLPEPLEPAEEIEESRGLDEID